MTYRILAIEDSTVIRKILKQTLLSRLYSLYEGSNGEEGLKLVGKYLDIPAQ